MTSRWFWPLVINSITLVQPYGAFFEKVLPLIKDQRKQIRRLSALATTKADRAEMRLASVTRWYDVGRQLT